MRIVNPEGIILSSKVLTLPGLISNNRFPRRIKSVSKRSVRVKEISLDLENR